MGEDPGVQRANEGCREMLVRQVREKRADSFGCGAETADRMSGWMNPGLKENEVGQDSTEQTKSHVLPTEPKIPH